MASQRLRALEREIRVLRKQFLPDPFDPLGSYPDSSRTHSFTRAFLVLSHAEVESYLEGWAKDIARAAQKRWTTSKRISEPLMFLLASLSERLRTPASLLDSRTQDSQEQLTETSKKVFEKFFKQIKDNHGVKESNVLSLFSPIGVPRLAMTATLLPTLNSFGASRGQHAHQSVKAVLNVLDPETEYTTVCKLLAELEPLDAWLRRYKQRIR